MLVDFMLIGAQKSGTTSLVHQLKQHPQICFCRHKEPHYFSKTIDWQERLTDYHQLYQPVPGQLCGEASTSYSFCTEYPQTAVRLFTYNPALKLIYIMRHPVERIASHYRHRWTIHGLRAQPDEVVLQDPTYLDRSRYATQLRAYLDKFPRSQICLLIFEEFIQQPRQTLAQIAQFLNISRDDIDVIDFAPRNVSKNQTLAKKHRQSQRTWKNLFGLSPIRWQEDGRGNQPLPYKFPDSLNKELWRRLQSEVGQLEDLMNRSLDIWDREF